MDVDVVEVLVLVEVESVDGTFSVEVDVVELVVVVVDVVVDVESVEVVV